MYFRGREGRRRCWLCSQTHLILGDLGGALVQLAGLESGEQRSRWALCALSRPFIL